MHFCHRSLTCLPPRKGSPPLRQGLVKLKGRERASVTLRAECLHSECPFRIKSSPCSSTCVSSPVCISRLSDSDCSSSNSTVSNCSTCRSGVLIGSYEPLVPPESIASSNHFPNPSSRCLKVRCQRSFDERTVPEGHRGAASHPVPRRRTTRRRRRSIYVQLRGKPSWCLTSSIWCSSNSFIDFSG